MTSESVLALRPKFLLGFGHPLDRVRFRWTHLKGPDIAVHTVIRDTSEHLPAPS